MPLSRTLHGVRTLDFVYWPFVARVRPQLLTGCNLCGLLLLQVAAYYPKAIPLMKHPLVRREMHDEWAAEVEARKKAGKGPPKKGQGKRASRKK